MEANSSSAGQDIPCLLWNPNIHCHVLKSQLLGHVLSQVKFSDTFRLFAEEYSWHNTKTDKLHEILWLKLNSREIALTWFSVKAMTWDSSGCCKSGEVANTSLSWAGGSCSNTWKLCGFVRWQHLMNPSHTFFCFQTWNTITTHVSFLEPYAPCALLHSGLWLTQTMTHSFFTQYCYMNSVRILFLFWAVEYSSAWIQYPTTNLLPATPWEEAQLICRLRYQLPPQYFFIS